MTRREMLAGTGSTLAWLSTAGVHAQSPLLKNMGGEPPGFGHRSRAGNSTSSNTAAVSVWAPFA